MLIKFVSGKRGILLFIPIFIHIQEKFCSQICSVISVWTHGYFEHHLLIYPALRKREKGRFIARVDSNRTVYSQRVLYPLPYDKMSRVVVILVVVLIITQLPFVIYLQMWLIHELSGGRVLDTVRTQSFVIGYGLGLR
ncbi:Hypothetical predicted protein [Paramuricea clavata]|uniref:Uncharacterized protein n=1 Tax=Paramuricea clavata TaxID=317549 RepID=A0A7D9DQA6_PARCT|nr:Hypothetical predicted protein [Paramuricea clavata]